MIIGVLGLGRMGAIHARNLSAMNGVDLVVFDPDDAATQHVVGTTGAKALPDREAVIGEVDAVVIATPTAAHPDDIDMAARAGLPIFCEKPISLEIDSTVRALQFAEKAGVEVQIGFMRRFDTGFLNMKRSIDSGHMGELYMVRGASHDHFLPEESYLVSAGSIHQDMHIHDFDALRWLTSREITEVYAAGSVLVDERFTRQKDVDMTALVLTLEGGVLASLTGARVNPLGYDHRMEVIGSKDAVSAGWTERTPIRSAEPGGIASPIHPWPNFTDRFALAYNAEIEAFVGMVRASEPNTSPGHVAVEALRVALAANQSWLEHRPISLSEVQV